MKKKLYYVVEHEYQNVGEIEEQTGNKSVTMYSIDNNVPTRMGILYISNESDSDRSIQNWLDDNGHENEEFDLIQL